MVREKERVGRVGNYVLQLNQQRGGGGREGRRWWDESGWWYRGEMVVGETEGVVGETGWGSGRDD